MAASRVKNIWQRNSRRIGNELDSSDGLCWAKRDGGSEEESVEHGGRTDRGPEKAEFGGES